MYSNGSGPGLCREGFLNVLNLQVLAPPSRLAGFLKVLNWQVLAPLTRLAFMIGDWLALECISKNCDFAGVGPAVDDGLYYRVLLCIRKDF